MKSGQGGKNFDDQYFWPLWDFCNEHNMPISVHANTRDWGTVADPKRIGDGWGFYVGTLTDYLVITCGMIYSGAFDAFPNLRFCLAEAGCTWLPWIWDRLALSYEMETPARNRTKKHPTEYLLTNLYQTVDPTEESLGHLIDRFGSGMSSWARTIRTGTSPAAAASRTRCASCVPPTSTCCSSARI